MEKFSQKGQEGKKLTGAKIFSVPFPLEEITQNIIINTFSKTSKEKIINQAFKFHSEGNINQAVRCYQLFIQQGFEDERVFSNYGNILNDLGNLKEAEIFYRRAIDLNPNFADAQLNLGAILRDIGNLKEAEVSTRKAIKLRPDLAEAHSNLGLILTTLGRFNEAELSIKKAIKLKQDLPDAHLNLGTILIELGKLEEAESSTRIAIQLNPYLAASYQNISLLYYSKGKINLALENIEKALLIDPISKNNQLLKLIFRDEKKGESQEKSNPLAIKINKDKKPNYPVILKRPVEPGLITSLYEIKALDLNKFQDPSFGKARGSDYKFFEDNEEITQTIKQDLTSIAKKVINSDVFFHDSFFTILSGTSIIKKHNHIVGHIDKFTDLKLWEKKYSLVYYLCVGDQDSQHPGLLKFYPDKDCAKSSEEILPSEGLIVIFPADKYHSVMYDGTKDRVILGVNFYSIQEVYQDEEKYF